MKRLITGAASAVAVIAVITACGTTTVTKTVHVPGPTVTKTVHVPGPVRTVIKVKDVPTTAPAAPAPAPATSAPVTAAHAGEVYCTYVRMNTALCSNGGYITGLNGPYINGSLSYYDGWYPVSQETYG